MAVRISQSRKDIMKTHQEFFQTEAEAVAYAATKGGNVTRLEDKSRELPETFYAFLGTSTLAIPTAVREWATAHGKTVKAAWDYAQDGEIRAVNAADAVRIDGQFRRDVVTVRWMVTIEDRSEEDLLARVNAAEAAGRVKVQTRQEDTGYSYYTYDVGARAYDETGKCFASRGSLRDGGKWYAEKE